MADQADPLSALSGIPAPPRSGEHWSAFVDILQRLHIGGAGWPAELEYARRWYEPHLERIHEDAAMRQADLVQLEQIAAGYPSREQFLTELTLDPPDATSDQAGVPLRDEDYLILSTIHSAKGQEWKSVFVLNVVDGCIPSDLGAGTTAEIEEERRLLYVAMTRARDSLHLVVPQRFFTHGQNAQGDRHVYASRTRFIPAALLQHFECVTWPLAAAVPAGGRKRGTSVSTSAPGCAACGGDPHVEFLLWRMAYERSVNWPSPSRPSLEKLIKFGRSYTGVCFGGSNGVLEVSNYLIEKHGAERTHEENWSK
jgi:DNA helicase-2/ATP-dependent DNA helicase PcrA